MIGDSVDSSKRSLKAVLPHYGKVKQSNLVAHVVGVKEIYESIKAINKVINYCKHAWNIYGDLKVVLLRMQMGYTCISYASGTVAITRLTMKSRNGLLNLNLGSLSDKQGERLHRDFFN